MYIQYKTQYFIFDRRGLEGDQTEVRHINESHLGHVRQVQASRQPRHRGPLPGLSTFRLAAAKDCVKFTMGKATTRSFWPTKVAVRAKRYGGHKTCFGDKLYFVQPKNRSSHA